MIKPIHRRRRKASGMLLRLGIPLLAAAIPWGFGLFGFAALIPDQAAGTDVRTDAIAVLTGGSGRLDEGLRLLAEGRADKLFVSGVYRGVDVAKLLELGRRTPEELACCIEIGHSAGDTEGNAAETADWMRDHGYRSLRLVTANYHMPRALLEFRDALPGVDLVPNPVFPEQVKRERWWAWPGTASLIIGEYNKYILAWVRHRVALPGWGGEDT